MRLEMLGDQPVIDSERFRLRPLRPSDAGLIGMYSGDARVARMTKSVPQPLPPGAAEAFVAQATAESRTEDIWALDASAHGLGELIGVVGLERMGSGQSEIDYWVAPLFWNTGVASEAIRAIVSANPHGARTLFAEVFQDNPVSARILTNNGFDYLGDAEAYSVARNAKVATWTYLRRMG